MSVQSEIDRISNGVDEQTSLIAHIKNAANSLPTISIISDLDAIIDIQESFINGAGSAGVGG